MWVKDIDRSTEFYRGLGFEVIETWMPEEKILWCCMKFSNAQIMLQQITGDSTESERQPRDTGIELYLVTDDVQQLYEKFLVAGYKVSVPTVAFYGMKQIFLHDPDGRTLCFEESVIGSS